MKRLIRPATWGASRTVAARATGCMVEAAVGTSNHAPVVMTTG